MHVVGPKCLLGESLGPTYTIDFRCSPFFNNMAYVRHVDLLFYHVYNWFKRGFDNKNSFTRNVTQIVLIKKIVVVDRPYTFSRILRYLIFMQ